MTGCAPPSPTSLATELIEAPGATGVGFGDPQRAVNGVRGGGQAAQSLDVYAVPLESHLVVGFHGGVIVDGPGADLVVFENPFDYGEELRFMDPTVVEVSDDGQRWFAFPHDYLASDERRYSARPSDWEGFAGIQPVLLHDEANSVDPFSAEAGGDHFDLADLPPDAPGNLRYVRLSAASAWSNPDTGEAYPMDPVSDGPDIDGVFARVEPADP